jgi:hypothetical protein
MNTDIMQRLLHYIGANPYPLTYCAIGSATRVTVLSDYIPRMQQILPPFLDLTMPTRVINIDPRFSSSGENDINFLHEYFKSKNIGFTYDNSNGMHRWISENNVIEVIWINQEFDYPSNIKNNVNNNSWFFEGLIESAFSINSKLIVQDYSGNDTSLIFKMLFDQSLNKEEFKNNIIFDFTYGHNHCDVDLERYKPLEDSKGNFINIMLMTVEELMPLLHTHQLIDEHINNHYINKYREIINIIPVDYRRKKKIESEEMGIGLVGYMNKYTIHDSFEKIINILKSELDQILPILRHIGIMNPEKEDLLQELINNHGNYTVNSKPDINWWSTQFYKIL